MFNLKDYIGDLLQPIIQLADFKTRHSCELPREMRFIINQYLSSRCFIHRYVYSSGRCIDTSLPLSFRYNVILLGTQQCRCSRIHKTFNYI